MYETVTLCPICENTNLENNLVCKDHSVSGESFMLIKCNKCNTKITSPRPLKTNIENYYSSENYVSHTNKSNNIVNTLYKVVRKYTIYKKIKLIESLSKPGKVLDIGCGTGVFLNACHKKGWSITGIEPNDNAWRNSILNTNNCYYKNVSDIKENEKFDIITLWHVLEHLYNPNEELKKLKTLLKPEGKIIIAVPNFESWDAQYYKENWAAYDVPRHLFHFSQKSIKTLVKLNHLKIHEILPMHFDSYYVSMLSEKYNSGKTNYIKALVNGLKSNMKAGEKKDYSSLIYILENKTLKQEKRNKKSVDSKTMYGTKNSKTVK